MTQFAAVGGWLNVDLAALTVPSGPLRELSGAALEAAHLAHSISDALVDITPQVAAGWSGSPGAAAAEAAMSPCAGRFLTSAGTLAHTSALVSDFASRWLAWQQQAAAAVDDGNTASHQKFSAVFTAADPLAASAHSPSADEAGDKRAADNAIEMANSRLTRLVRTVTDEADRLAAQLRAAAATLADNWPDAVGPMPSSAAYHHYLAAWAAQSLALPTRPDGVGEWWASLNTAQQGALIAAEPRSIGNTNGLPAAARDQANQLALSQDLRQARDKVAASGGTWLAAGADPSAPGPARVLDQALRRAGYTDAQAAAIKGAAAVEFQLAHLADQFPTGSPVPQAQLLIYDPAAFGGKGRAAIALGDVGEAQNIAVCVPGMTSDVPGYLDNQTSNAAHLWTASRQADPRAHTAVVAYIGYDAPGIDLGVTNVARAIDGGQWISDDLAGLAATRAQDHPAFVSVIGHSYGSATVADAFADHHAQADQVILIGSPGAGGAHTAQDLQLPENRVWVGANSADPVTTEAQSQQDSGGAIAQGYQMGIEIGHTYGLDAGPLSDLSSAAGIVGAALGALGQQTLKPNLGTDPADRSFGARRFRAENGNKDPLNFANHSQYYQPGSESLDNMADLVTNHPDRVEEAPLRDDPAGHWTATGDDPEYARETR